MRGSGAACCADLGPAGSESSFLQCPMAVEDVAFCSPDESIVQFLQQPSSETGGFTYAKRRFKRNEICDTRVFELWQYVNLFLVSTLAVLV